MCYFILYNYIYIMLPMKKPIERTMILGDDELKSEQQKQIEQLQNPIVVSEILDPTTILKTNTRRINQ